MMKPLSSQAFDAVTRLFHGVSGIRLSESKHALVTGRLQRLASEAGETDLERYVDKLLRGGAPAQEMTRLIDRLTTNETYFFREPQHYNDLADRLALVPAGQDFKVWSAASSSGEEAYSVAMLLGEQLGHAPWQVIGTDLSTAMVESARRGLYPMDRARMVPPGYLKRFCLKGQGEHEGQNSGHRAVKLLADHLIFAGGVIDRTRERRDLEAGHGHFSGQLTHRQSLFAAPFGEHDGGRSLQRIIGHGDREMRRVGDDELRLTHRAVKPAFGDLTLALADRLLLLRAAFGFLVLVAQVLMAHFQAHEAAGPLDGKVDQGDQHKAR